MVMESPTTGGLTTATLRAIEALGDGHTGRVDLIVDRLSEAIRVGLLAPGERLPPEGILSQQLGVATHTLRGALATLRERGLVVTRRGRTGGSFVADGGADGDALAAAGAPTTRRLRELGDVRLAVLGRAAALAAQRATMPEIETLRRCLARLATATTASERRRADGALAIEIAAAAQAPRLCRQEANLRAELGDLVWNLVDDRLHAVAVAQRTALVDAVAARDAHRAWNLVAEQIAHETESILRWRVGLMQRAGGSSAASSGDEGLSGLIDDFERIFMALTDTASAFAASASAGRDRYATGDVASLRPHIWTALDGLGDLASGLGLAMAPGVLVDAEFWLEWQWRPHDRDPEALRVNLDPASPDFFDYSRAEWFTAPLATRRRQVTGPSVDYACANEYVLTFSVPVYLGDRPLGVCAVDISCDPLERAVLPVLSAEPTPRALVNRHGRVIAAASKDVVCGDLLDATRCTEEAPSAPELARLCAQTNWTLMGLPPGGAFAPGTGASGESGESPSREWSRSVDGQCDGILPSRA